MTSTQDDPLQSPQESDSESHTSPRDNRPRLIKSPLTAIAARFPYRRSNASLTNLFASTSSLSGSPVIGASDSGPNTPTGGFTTESVLSPGGSTVLGSVQDEANGNNEIRDLIVRALAPHVSVLASTDTEELIRHKGVHGGFLELLRPFGERINGKVTIRDSSGASHSWEDFGVRFVGAQDGVQVVAAADRTSSDSPEQNAQQRLPSLEYKPARLRAGGNVAQVEDLIERHLTFAEEQSGPVEIDYLTHAAQHADDARTTSPFYLHYIRRLLSGLPLVASETFSHPVASIIAISSRCAAPIEELRNLYTSSNTGENRLPHWVHNEFLRYYVLVHDEDYDDITKSMALFDQMKRHFGLHCHLLRLRSTLCAASDDGSARLPTSEWMSAAEDLSEITRRESSEDEDDPTPYIFETDSSALQVLVREMVTQSVIPAMERASATWNDQIASRRRGLSGRFMSLSKRFTGFSARTTSMPIASSNSNYDSVQGIYRAESPEALMRKLADYSMMLRDYKLAQSTYEILCQDFKTEKAWRYYAAANEMMTVSTLLINTKLTSKTRAELDQCMENAYYSYITRVGAPYNALRTVLVCVELLKMQSGSACDDAARWASRILEDRLTGPIGHVLVMERVASCFVGRTSRATPKGGHRHRKAAFWNILATSAWLRLDKASRAQARLEEARRLYQSAGVEVRFEGMVELLGRLARGVEASRAGPQHLDEADLIAAGDVSANAKTTTKDVPAAQDTTDADDGKANAVVDGSQSSTNQDPDENHDKSEA